MTWPRYIENRTIVRRVIMRLNCISKITVFDEFPILCYMNQKREDCFLHGPQTDLAMLEFSCRFQKV